MQCQVIVKGPREGQFLPFAKNVRRGLLAAATIHRVQILSEGVSYFYALAFLRNSELAGKKVKN